MHDYEVRHMSSGKLETILQNYDNILMAKDAFARQKGYEDWGNWVAKYKESFSDTSRPPYTFKKIN